MLGQLNGFTFNHADQPDRPSDIYSASEIKTQWDSRAEELRIKLNNIIAELLSTAGAGNIGVVAISGLTGSTVQAVLLSLKGYTNTLVGDLANALYAHETLAVLDHPDGSVITSKLADLAVTAAKILDGAVNASKLATDSVTTVKIAAASVTSAKIVDGAITSAKLDSASVTAAKLDEGAVISSKVADSAITTDKLTDSSVTAAKLASAAVTAAKIADAAISDVKLSNSPGQLKTTFANHVSDNKRHVNSNESTVTGLYANAEGGFTTASGEYSHAEGSSTTASGFASHAEGIGTFAGAFCTHTEGSDTQALDDYCHAEGWHTISQGLASHAEGSGTTASGYHSHAEGQGTLASGESSHAEGDSTVASGRISHAEGFATSTSLREGAHIMGKYGNANADYGWFLANGISTASKGLAAKILQNGTMTADGAYSSAGADYAEMFEWVDGNPRNEDRVGFFITLDGEKVKKATSSDEYILGVVSANPAIIGDDGGLRWQGKYQLDEWGRIRYHFATIPAVTIDIPRRDDNGNEFIETVLTAPERLEWQPILNPEWNNNEPYVDRLTRPEWAAVGMMGKLLVRDDGTCAVNGYCKPNDNGEATASLTGYRVMSRISHNIVKVLIK